jgi:hypothetical protein
MERRRFKRIKVNLRAERISGDEKYAVFIENISEHGIHMITTSSHTHKKYKSGTELELKFKLPTGETINLHCKTQWAYSRIPPEKVIDSIGLEIIDPPLQYIKFVRALHQSP